MHSKIVLFVVAWLHSPSQAIPQPEIIINERKTQCGWFWRGGGCRTCTITSGEWIIIPFNAQDSSNNGCPVGYQFTEENQLPIECTYKINDRNCCTDYGPGDFRGMCPNLWINHFESVNALIERISCFHSRSDRHHLGLSAITLP